MAYIFVADDFTGASDTLATLAQAGLRARLFLDVPEANEVEGLEAWGVATHARSLDSGNLKTLADDLGRKLASFQPSFLHVKVCSTFDSAAETGNMAILAETLGEATGARKLAIIGGQPSLGRFCIFGNLFARAPDGDVYRIDRHPIMASHPVTPMKEADLLRHFARLGLAGLNLVARGASGRAIAFPRLYDVLEQTEIQAIGRELVQEAPPCVVIGPSSVAEAWLHGHGIALAASQPALSVDSPILAFAGSRSSLTASQVAAADRLARHPVSPSDLNPNSQARDSILHWASERLAGGQDCLLFLTADSAGDATPAMLARWSADLLSLILKQATVGALVIAGGDTSSAIVQELRPRYLEFAGIVCPGVSALVANVSGRAMPLILKGGQMGDAGFFQSSARFLGRN
ncbi:MAG: four-carbon acid sugar kinase family protein [Aliihoeflea sp.]